MTDLQWFAVTVEHDASGIRGVHYVQAIFPSTAEELAVAPGYHAVEVRPWPVNTRYPKLPGYVGRQVT